MQTGLHNQEVNLRYEYCLPLFFSICICVIEDYMYWLLLKGDGNRVMDYFAWFGCIELWKVDMVIELSKVDMVIYY